MGPRGAIGAALSNLLAVWPDTGLLGNHVIYVYLAVPAPAIISSSCVYTLAYYKAQL